MAGAALAILLAPMLQGCFPVIAAGGIYGQWIARRIHVPWLYFSPK